MKFCIYDALSEKKLLRRWMLWHIQNVPTSRLLRWGMFHPMAIEICARIHYCPNINRLWNHVKWELVQIHSYLQLCIYTNRYNYYSRYLNTGCNIRRVESTKNITHNYRAVAQSRCVYNVMCISTIVMAI